MPEDLDTPDDEQQPDDNAVIRELRQKAGRTEAAESDAQAARRELTLHKAGLGTLTDKQMKALTAAHDGDWDAELLKATATELGFVREPDEHKDEPKVPQEELDAHRRVAAAANGETPAPDNLDAAMEAAKDDPVQLMTVLRNAGILLEDD